MKTRTATPDPMTSPLASFRDPEATGFDAAWVGMEPTFQSRKSVQKWRTITAEPGGEDAYFLDRYMLKTERQIAKAIKRKYDKHRAAAEPYCMFANVELDEDLDQWQVRRQTLAFHWPDANREPFEVRVALDPETFEYSIKPVPLAWFYDERFVAFLHQFIWKVPQKLGLSCSMAHGGGQFSLSAKTFLIGSLLADDIAYKASHPELATWIMDWPNPDDRTFRATNRRLAAFRAVVGAYWDGRFHPRLNGSLTAENAYLDRGFGPARIANASLMDPRLGPIGTQLDVFQTNFAFGRTIRLAAQSIDPGYWQSPPDEDGYRPDQVMRYGEGNLNRLQIAGELHVKSGKVLDATREPELDAPLDFALLTTEASWENRAQMCRTSARDYVEALLLDVHHARYLQAHPHVAITTSLHQDQILGEAEATLKRYRANAVLDRLHRDARVANLEASNGRIRSDRIEPEALFWAAWHVLPRGDQYAIAREAISGFVERVQQAASVDPRGAPTDPMEWHRHRIHPILWHALDAPGCDARDPIQRERATWLSHKKRYQSRRPIWSQLKNARPPWSVHYER
jgi:hypothetical protein